MVGRRRQRLTFRGRFTDRPLIGPDTNARFWLVTSTRYDAALDITTAYLREATPEDATARGAGEVCSITEHLMANGAGP